MNQAIIDDGDDLEDLRPAMPHSLMICEAKTICLDEDRPPTPRWKMFRWKEWAKRNGIFLEERNIYSLHIYSAFKKKEMPMKLPKGPYSKFVS